MSDEANHHGVDDSQDQAVVDFQAPTNMVGVCRWKDCKKVAKQGDDCAICTCTKVGYDRVVHAGCGRSMLDTFGACSEFGAVACSKRCYNALIKQATATESQVKKRVVWHNDGPSANISSISVLIDWLTTGTNYSRYRGGEGHSVVAGIKTTRNVKDITNKISALETSFRLAEDWRSCTGQGFESNDPSIRSALLQRCSYYFELLPIMLDRDSTHPQLLTTVPAARADDTEGDDDSHSDEESQRPKNSSSPPSQIERPASTPLSIVRSPTSKRRRKDSGEPPAPFLLLKKARLAQTKELQLMEHQMREKQVKLQEQELVVRQRKMENERKATDARKEEANAQASKYRQEAEHWRQQRKITLLRERQKLLKEGVSQADIDLLLPLTTYF